MSFKITPPEDNPYKYEGLDWETCGPNTIFTDKKTGKIRLIEYWNGVDEYYNENEVCRLYGELISLLQDGGAA